jgi:hypothetical protein
MSILFAFVSFQRYCLLLSFIKANDHHSIIRSVPPPSVPHFFTGCCGVPVCFLNVDEYYYQYVERGLYLLFMNFNLCSRGKKMLVLEPIVVK